MGMIAGTASDRQVQQRQLHALGARLLVVSNACGGMHPLWSPGELMLIADPYALATHL